MNHPYYGIYDRQAKCYIRVSEDKNNNTFRRMMEIMEKDEKTMIGQCPQDYTGYHIADFDDETGKFTSIEPEKVWEGKAHE